MKDEFAISPALQQTWGWMAAVSFSLEGTGGGLFLVGWWLGFWAPAIPALLMVAMAMSLLVADLKRPERFWRVLARPLASWASRGAWLMGLFLFFGALAVALNLRALDWLPWTQGGALTWAFTVLAGLFALAIAMYSGLLMASLPGVQFWGSSLLPLLSLSYSLCSGAAILFVLSPILMDPRAIGGHKLLINGSVFALGTTVLLLLFPLMIPSYRAEMTRELKVKDVFPPRFWRPLMGGCLLSLLAALVLISSLDKALASFAPVALVSGALILFSGFAFRYLVLQAGIQAGPHLR